MVKKALFFVENTPVFLDNWVKKGHDTCHKIEGYDVSQCNRDCKVLEESDFARDCEKEGGLFKCCIRWPICCVFMFVYVDDLLIIGETKNFAMNVGIVAPSLSVQLKMEQSLRSNEVFSNN